MPKCKDKNFNKAKIAEIHDLVDSLSVAYKRDWLFMSFVKPELLGDLWNEAKPILETDRGLTGCVLAMRMYYLDTFASGVFHTLFPTERIYSKLFHDAQITEFIMRAGLSDTAIARITAAHYLGMLSANVSASFYEKSDDGNILIHSAAKNGWMDVIASMLDSGVYIDVVGKHGETSLMKAKASAVMEWLMKRGASIHTRADNGDIPLHFAVRNHAEDAVIIMLDKGAPVDAIGCEGRTPLMLVGSGQNKEGALATAKLLLERGASVLAKANDGDMPIHFAARNGLADVVAYMLDTGVSVNARGAKNRTPFMLAKNEDTARLLIEREACLWSQDQEENSFLHVAAMMNHCNASSFLLNYYLKTHLNTCDWLRLVEGRNKQGRTPLMESISPSMAKLLLSAGADSDARDAQGNQAIHLAIMNGKVNMARFWLNSMPQLVESPGGSIASPLALAMSCEDVELVRLLHQRNASLSVRDKYGGTVLHFAARVCDVELLKALLSNEDLDINVAHNCDGSIQLETEESHTYTRISLDDKHGTRFEFSVKVGNLCWMKADAYSRDLELTVMDSKYAELVKHCNVRVTIEKVHDGLICSQYAGATPLHLAAKFGQDECVKLLIDRNANISAIAYDGAMPIHYAVFGNHLSAVELLVEAGANIGADLPNNTAALNMTIQCNETNLRILRVEPMLTDSVIQMQNACIDSQYPSCDDQHTTMCYGSADITTCSGAVEPIEEQEAQVN